MRGSLVVGRTAALAPDYYDADYRYRDSEKRNEPFSELLASLFVGQLRK